MNEIIDIQLLIIPIKTVVIYICSLVLIRLGNKRMFGVFSAFDFLVAIILGSVLSRAINSSAPMVPTIASGAMLVALHWLTAALSYYSTTCRYILRGKAITLIENGEIQRENLRKAQVSKADFLCSELIVLLCAKFSIQALLFRQKQSV